MRAVAALAARYGATRANPKPVCVLLFAAPPPRGKRIQKEKQCPPFADTFRLAPRARF